MSTSTSFKLVDGQELNAIDGYSYISDWVDIHSISNFSVNAVFTDGNPAGSLFLQQSNDRQTSLPGKVVRLVDSSGENSSGPNKRINDAASVPAGTGLNSITISGAGSYALNQFLAPYHWFRVVYSASVDAETQLDIFVHLKK